MDFFTLHLGYNFGQVKFFLGQVWGRLLVCFMCFMKHTSSLPQTITTMFTMVVFTFGVHTKLWYLFFMHLKHENWHHEFQNEK